MVGMDGMGYILCYFLLPVVAGPAVLGYCLGRWMPFYVRLIPLFFILWVTAQGDWTPGHGYENIFLGYWIYAYFCRRGLKRKAEDRDIAYENLLHVDWIIMVIAPILAVLLASLLADL